MTNGLMALEQSLNRKRRVKRKASRKSEGLNVPAPAQLRQQIEVVQGKRVGQPSSGLRALEDRLLGKTPPQQTGTPQMETQRLDSGQAPLTTPRIEQPLMPPAHATMPIPSTSDNRVPTSATQIPSAQGYGTQSYAPEFSAPNTGRFHVEPFSEPSDPQDLFKPAAAVSQPSTPTAPINSPATVPDQQPSPQATQPAQQPGQTTAQQPQQTQQQRSDEPAFLLDNDSWIQQAQEDQPQKISETSRNSLDSSAALAKDDFERDLAAILGHSPQPQQPVATAQAPQQNASPQQAEPTEPTETDPSAPPPHPNHDIFDQMGLGMQYANSFDLGEVNLQDRFNQFDRELEQPKTAMQPSQAQSVQNPFVSPMDLDEFDLVAELAEIGAESPQLAKAACAPQKSDQPTADNNLTERHPQQETSANKQTQQDPPAEQEPITGQAPTQQITDNNQTQDTAGEHHEQPTG